MREHAAYSYRRRALLAACLAVAIGACRYRYERLPVEADAASGAPGAGAQGLAANGAEGGDAQGGNAQGGNAQTGGATAAGSPSDDAGAANAGAAGAPDTTSCGDEVLEATEECEPATASAEDLCQVDCRYDWYDRSYASRRRVAFDNSASNLPLAAFVVPVVLTPADIDYAGLQATGDDLLFVDGDNQQVFDYEIEAFNPGGTSVVWVRIPTIPAGVSYGFWLYYGKPGASAASNAAATWSVAFAAVYHLMDGAVDSAGNSDGTITGAVGGVGQLASALDFPSTAAVVDAGSLISVDDLFETGGTISAWIRPRAWGQGNFGRIVDKASDVLTQMGWALQVDGGTEPNHTVVFEHGFSDGLGRWNGPDETVALDTWTHVALVYDGSNATHTPVLYLNGTQRPVTALDTPAGVRASDADQNLGIGEQVATGQRSFDGLLDEVRLQRIARSPAWIFAEYSSALTGAVSVGPEQTHL